MIKLEIVVDDAGKVSVTGPLDQPVMCYGLLEFGRQTLQKHFESQSKPKLVVVPALPFPNGAPKQ